MLLFVHGSAHRKADNKDYKVQDKMKVISQDDLKKAVTYSPESGLFTGKRGYEIGHPSVKGYVYISINGNRFFAHRLAWLYVYGEMPNGFLDHINHDKSDNRIDNLRVIDIADNLRYRTGSRNAELKIKGVRINRSGRFQARISYDGVRIALGTYTTSDEAAHAYNKAALDLFGEFAVLNPIGSDY